MFPSQKSHVERLAVHGTVASMGPGCFHPRNARWNAGGTQQYLLQWGLDVSIPEIGDPSQPSAAQAMASMGPGCFHPRNKEAAVDACVEGMLQWGRDVSIPEMSPSYPFRADW